MHDEENNTYVGGRNPEEWRKLGFFYVLFYGCITAFWAANFAGMTASLPEESEAPMEVGLDSRGKVNFVGYSNMVNCPVTGCPAYGHPSPQLSKIAYVHMYGPENANDRCPITEDRQSTEVTCPTPAESAYNINFGSFEVLNSAETTVTLQDGNPETGATQYGNRFEQYGLHSGEFALLSDVNPNTTAADANRDTFQANTAGAEWCFNDADYGLSSRRACLFTYLNNVWGYPTLDDSGATLRCNVTGVRPYPVSEQCSGDNPDASCPSDADLMALAPVVTVASDFQCENGTSIGNCKSFANQPDYLSARHKPLGLVAVDWSGVPIADAIAAVGVPPAGTGSYPYGGIEASINCDVPGISGPQDDLYPDAATLIRVRSIFQDAVPVAN